MAEQLSVRERIMVALLQLLTDLPRVTKVARNKAEPFTAAELPALNLIDGDQTPDHSVHGQTLYRMTVTIEGFVAAADSEAAVVELNALYARVAALLSADQRLATAEVPDGLALSVEEADLVIDLARGGEEPQAAFGLNVDVQYITAVGKPYVLGPA